MTDEEPEWIRVMSYENLPENPAPMRAIVD
jgi:hypothetical protein